MTTPPSIPASIYKVATRDLVAQSRRVGRFLGAPIDIEDGYIHFSTASQLRDTLRLYFAGQDDLIVFSVRCADLGDALRWEPSRGGALFPHLYGELSMHSVGQQAAISVSASGAVSLPEWVA